MRIIIIGTAYPYRGGLAAFNERLARQYQAEGHEVEMITFTLQYPKILFPGRTQLSSEAQPRDLNITRMMSSINPFSWIKTGKEIRKKNPDKVIFCYWMAFMAPCFTTVAKYARGKNTKLIGLIHNMIPHEPTILDKLFPKYFVRAMDGFLGMADAVIQDINSFDKADKPKILSPHPLYDHYGEKMNRSVAALRLGLDENKRYILFFGFIRKYKGLDILLQAFSDKRLRDFPVQLIVAGEFYDNQEYYLKLIRELGLELDVELRTRFISDNEIQSYFSVVDIVAQPYRSATQSGVSQIAYHFDTPILVTNVGGLPEIVPHEKVGYVVDVNPEKIADALFDFFVKDRYSEFSENIKEEKKKYTWSEMTKALNKL